MSVNHLQGLHGASSPGKSTVPACNLVIAEGRHRLPVVPVEVSVQICIGHFSSLLPALDQSETRSPQHAMAQPPERKRKWDQPVPAQPAGATSLQVSSQMIAHAQAAALAAAHQLTAVSGLCMRSERGVEQLLLAVLWSSSSVHLLFPCMGVCTTCSIAFQYQDFIGTHFPNCCVLHGNVVTLCMGLWRGMAKHQHFVTDGARQPTPEARQKAVAPVPTPPQYVCFHHSQCTRRHTAPSTPPALTWPRQHNPLCLPCPPAALNLCQKQAAGLNPAAAAQAAAIAQQAAAAQVVTALQHSSGPRSGSGVTAAGVKLPAGGPDIAREVVINDAGHHIRQLLTKRQTLDEISKRTNTQLVVRGRFVPGGSQNASGTDRPLYLRVTPTTNAGQVCVRSFTWLTKFVAEKPQHRIMSCWLHGRPSCRCSI